MVSPIRRLRRWPAPLRRALYAVLLAYAAYLVAANVYLNTPLFEASINQKPEKFVLRTGPAISLLPSHVIAWKVRASGHVQHTVWQVRADRASARIALLPLLRREVRIPRLHATGVDADVQRVDAEIPPPPAGDRGWTLRFDAIHSDSIRRARFGQLVLEGKGSGTVGFLKQIRGGPSELFPSTVAFTDARLLHGRLTLADQAALEGSFSYPRHYRAQAPGIRKLGILSAGLKLSGRSAALRVDSGGGQVDIRMLPAQAHLNADLKLERGELQPGSRAVWRIPLRVGVGATDRGVLTLRLDAAQDIRVRAHLPHDEKTDTLIDADLHIAGRSLPFEDPSTLWPRTSGQVRGRWTFESLDWIGALFVRKPWFKLHGGGLVDADLRLERGRLQPGSTLQVPHAQAVAEVMGVRAQGRASAQGRIVAAGDGTQAVLDVAMQAFEAAPLAAPEQLLVRGDDLHLQLRGEGELGRLHDSLQAQLRFADARIPDLRVYNRYLPGGNVRVLSGSGSLGGDLELDAAGKVGRGWTRLRASQARLQLAGARLRGDIDLDARLARADIERQVFALDGTGLRLQNVELEGDPGSRGSWATVTVPRGSIDAASPFQVDATARMRMRDVGLVLALFSRRADYPRWIGNMVDAGQVEAQGQLRWRKSRLWLDRLQAHNDRLSLQARLQLGQQLSRGELYARWGVLGVGVQLDGEQRQWHLLRARQWYESQPDLLH
ncbi:hypothetical protein [Stenotrophomonas sp. MMGLT7]|uniref:hypothetical protein n=1 Tax=Stenotrophomonas sp. MMGLT7 TaxID=2901227 RepID=UPI001E2AC238|nr:hypothetical protein [Stenotrophomonas sp. MMGLT7]MCD7097874.1 hypothetical protein [Stenotrophomonas sp. MMGLT7]